jgi:hypothetical protein
MPEITVPRRLVQHVTDDLDADSEHEAVIQALHLAAELNNPQEMLDGVAYEVDLPNP